MRTGDEGKKINKNLLKRSRFDAPPAENDIRLNIFGEIVKATNFDAQYL